MIKQHQCFCVLIFLILSSLSGCAGVKKNMEGWMGASEFSLFEQLGMPYQSISSNSRQVHFWRRSDDKDSCIDKFTVRNTQIIGYYSNCGIWGGLSAPKNKK
jgi:hypothetical protein|tara:strand:- start:3 stop:308 length:306 start_codon:yes stop_codon:yes gene_type:complete